MLAKLDTGLQKWPWSTIVAPVWAVACIFTNLMIAISSSSYTSVVAYNVKFAVAPWWIWVTAYIVVSIGVLWKRTPGWQIFQAGLTVTEGVAIFLASFGPQVSPTAGITFLVIGVSLWIGVMKTYGHINVLNNERRGRVGEK